GSSRAIYGDPRRTDRMGIGPLIKAVRAVHVAMSVNLLMVREAPAAGCREKLFWGPYAPACARTQGGERALQRETSSDPDRRDIPDHQRLTRYYTRTTARTARTKTMGKK